MTVSLKHTFQSAKTDSLDTSLVQPSNWNEEHELELATNKLLGRATAGTGAAEEIGIGTALSVSGGTLAVTNVPVANGGTGASTLTGYVKGNGTSAFTASASVPVGDISGTLPVASGGTGAATLPANNVLLGNGTSAVQSVAPGAFGNILVSNGTTWTSAPTSAGGSLDAVASGSLANGATVIINANGTVSSVTGQNQQLGSTTTFRTGTIFALSGTYDESQQKVVICYGDGSNSGFGTAVIGTVSGTTITFGTPVVFQSAYTDTSTTAVYHAGVQKVVFAYRNTSGFPRCIVGTVSGTTISFGTPVDFGAQPNTRDFSSVYDVGQQRVVFVWRESATLFAIAASVSGTTPTFGSAVTFGTSGTIMSQADGSMAYNSAGNNIILTYVSNNQNQARILTLSGSSISINTEFNLSSGSGVPSVAYDSTQNKAVFIYPNTTLRVKIGTISGTSITFGTEVTLTGTTSSSTPYIGPQYDVFSGKICINYRDAGNISRVAVGLVSGTSFTLLTDLSVLTGGTNETASINCINQNTLVFIGTTPSGIASAFLNQQSNLTATNFIGFSSAAYTNGQTATIQLVSAVDDAQTGLTPGQRYFVQLTGGIGLTASDPSVVAGIAVAANKIIVKG